MSKLVNAIQQSAQPMGRTANGAVTNVTSFSDCVDFFSLAGASRGKDITGVFDKALAEDKEIAGRILQWTRDVRGGAGERKTFRDLFTYLIENDLETAKRILPKVPEIGRWDDVLVAVGTPLAPEAFELIRAGLNSPEVAGLCAKWMPRQGAVAAALRKHMSMTPKGWRKMLVSLSNTVEQKMCARQWHEIEYGKLPSKAAAMYQNAFKRNDEERYQSYVDALVKGEAKINASAIFPHDVVISAQRGNSKVANEQWKALPDYFEGSGENVLPMIDVSGSMRVAQITKSATAMDIAIALGIYCAERNNGIFKNAYISFSEQPVLGKVQGTSIARKVASVKGKHVGYSTNFQAAFDLILTAALEHNLSQEDLPTMVLALSDMEFNQAENSGWSYSSREQTNFRVIKKKFEKYGYQMPTLVFWNLNGREGNQPVTIHDSGTALVSGFSPAIMKSILSAKTITPTDIMLDTVNVDRYNF